MKQLHHWTQHLNLDMTECKLNRIVDADGKAHFIISFPAEWKQHTDEAGRVAPGKFKVFEITRWEEVEIKL